MSPKKKNPKGRLIPRNKSVCLHKWLLAVVSIKPKRICSLHVAPQFLVQRLECYIKTERELYGSARHRNGTGSESMTDETG